MIFLSPVAQLHRARGGASLEHVSNRLSRGYDQQDPDDGAGQEDISQVFSIGFIGSVFMISLQVQCGGGDRQPVQGV